MFSHWRKIWCRAWKQRGHKWLQGWLLLPWRKRGWGVASKIYMVIGSMVVIDAKCSNDHCCIWQSQSCHGTLPWRDMLCAAAALFTRSNPTQVFTFFKNNGLPYISLRTYHYLPHPWCELWLDQWTAVPFNFQVKHTDVGCDARCDTPGHCVKYSIYHTVELDNNKALTIELVQIHSVVTIWSMSQAPINTVIVPFQVNRSFKITLQSKRIIPRNNCQDQNCVSTKCFHRTQVALSGGQQCKEIPLSTSLMLLHPWTTHQLAGIVNLS